MLHLYHHYLKDLDAEAIVRIVKEVDDPADAARTLVKTSSALWAEKNDYCDDITAIVIFISGDNVGSSGTIEIDQDAKQVISKDSKFRRLFKRREKQFSLFRSVFSRRVVQKERQRKVIT